MLPAITIAVSTDRMVAIPARVMATSTISAMISMVPRSRRGVFPCKKARLPRGFISARPPDPVAQGDGRFEHAVAVAFPVGRGRRARIPRRRHVDDAAGPAGTAIGPGSRLGAVGGGVTLAPVAAQRLFRLRAPRHDCKPH